MRYSDPMHPQAGPVAVTLAILVVYYAFAFAQLRVKTRLRHEYEARGEVFDRYRSDDPEMLAADRTLLNLLEQLPAFLVLLWLNAAFVGAASATIAGAIYVAARGAYPFLMGGRLGGRVPPRVHWSTGPAYLVLLWFAGALTVAMFAGA